MELNNERKRVIIYTWFTSGAKAVECHRNICNYLGQGTVSLRNVEEWYRKFRSGDFAIEDAEKTGRPTVVDDGDLRKVIDEDHNITTRELAAQFNLVTTCVTVTADVIHHRDDFDELTECVLLSFVFCLSVIRLVVYTVYRNDMQYVVDIMKEDWITSSYKDRIVLREKCTFAFRLAKYFIILIAGNIFMFACLPILETYLLGAKKKILPFRGYFFINQTIWPVYQCLYVFNVMAGIFVGGTISGVTSFNLIAITHGAAKFAMVRRRLEAISSNNPDVKQIMIDCIKRHQDSITFADILERLINILALGQFVISTGLVCFAGFQLTSMLQNKERLMKYSAFLCAVVLELFMFSFSGNNLITESDAVGESAYSSDWIGGTFGRSLQILMLRSTVPSKITAAKFYNMSFESFAKVLSTSFSYMMVLMATIDE